MTLLYKDDRYMVTLMPNGERALCFLDSTFPLALMMMTRLPASQVLEHELFDEWVLLLERSARKDGFSGRLQLVKGYYQQLGRDFPEISDGDTSAFVSALRGLKVTPAKEEVSTLEATERHALAESSFVEEVVAFSGDDYVDFTDLAVTSVRGRNVPFRKMTIELAAIKQPCRIGCVSSGEFFELRKYRDYIRTFMSVSEEAASVLHAAWFGPFDLSDPFRFGYCYFNLFDRSLWMDLWEVCLGSLYLDKGLLFGIRSRQDFMCGLEQWCFFSLSDGGSIHIRPYSRQIPDGYYSVRVDLFLQALDRFFEISSVGHVPVWDPDSLSFCQRRALPVLWSVDVRHTEVDVTEQPYDYVANYRHSDVSFRKIFLDMSASWYNGYSFRSQWMALADFRRVSEFVTVLHDRALFHNFRAMDSNVEKIRAYLNTIQVFLEHVDSAANVPNAVSGLRKRLSTLLKSVYNHSHLRSWFDEVVLHNYSWFILLEPPSAFADSSVLMVMT